MNCQLSMQSVPEFSRAFEGFGARFWPLLFRTWAGWRTLFPSAGLGAAQEQPVPTRRGLVPGGR